MVVQYIVRLCFVVLFIAFTLTRRLFVVALCFISSHFENFITILHYSISIHYIFVKVVFLQSF